MYGRLVEGIAEAGMSDRVGEAVDVCEPRGWRS